MAITRIDLNVYCLVNEISVTTVLTSLLSVKHHTCVVTQGTATMNHLQVLNKQDGLRHRGCYLPSYLRLWVKLCYIGCHVTTAKNFITCIYGSLKLFQNLTPFTETLLFFKNVFPSDPIICYLNYYQ